MTLPLSTKYIACCLLLTMTAVHGELRNLVSKNGDEIRAELLSHKGGKVTIRREDGLEFEVDPGIFCPSDKKDIEDWMQLKAASVNYEFSITGSELKSGKKHKADCWIFVITVTNNSRDTVSDLIFEYRVVYGKSTNDNSYGFHDGQQILEQDLDFKKTFKFASTEIVISTRGKADPYIIGCLLRIRDKEGTIVHEWVSDEPAMKDINWDTKFDDKQGKELAPEPGTGIIK